MYANNTRNRVSKQRKKQYHLKQFYHSSNFHNTALILISYILNEVCKSNDERGNNVTSKFTAARRPNIDLDDYLMRIAKYAECSNSCFVSALIYIDRVQTLNPSGFVVDTLNIHRLLATATMLAAKFYDDVYYNNAFWARIAGINTQELNSLEIELLFLLQFNLNIDEYDFLRYGSELQRHARRFNIHHVASDWIASPTPLISTSLNEIMKNMHINDDEQNISQSPPFVTVIQ